MKYMCFFQLMILRPHPHFTRLKIRRSTDPHFTGGHRYLEQHAAEHQRWLLATEVILLCPFLLMPILTPLTETETMYNWKHSQTRNIRSVRLLKMSFVVYTAPAAGAWFIRTAVCSLPHGQRINAFPPLRKRYQTLLFV